MPQIHAPPDAPAADPVRAALADPRVREKIATAARISLRRWMKYANRSALEDAAEEVAAEAQKTALEKAATFDPTRSAACTWIVGFVNNIALRRLDRSLRRKSVGLPKDLVDPTPSVEDRLIAAADKESLRSAIASLDPFDRRIADLHIEGKAHADVAAALGITPLNARVRVCRIKKELAAKLSPSSQGGQS